MARDPGYPGPVRPMIGAQLRRGAEAVHEAVHTRLARAGHDDLRPAHLALLQYPGPHGAHPTELAARVGLRKQALNFLLNDLEEMGYLRRTNDDGDRRGRVLQLTPRGMSLVRVMRETLDEIEQRVRDELGAPAFEALLVAVVAVQDAALVTAAGQSENALTCNDVRRQGLEPRTR